jgi:ketosteroid isomerase-like protein
MGVEDNKRVVLAYLASMGGGSAAGLLAEDATWWLPRFGAIPLAELARISERIRPRLATGVAMTVDHITAEGDRVAVETRGHARTVDGQDYDNAYHFLFFLRGGQIVEIHEHGDSAYAHRVFGFNLTEHLEASKADAEPLAPRRRFLTPLPEETLEAIAARAALAAEDVKRWNPHIFETRRPPGLITGSDIVFVEPPTE